MTHGFSQRRVSRQTAETGLISRALSSLSVLTPSLLPACVFCSEIVTSFHQTDKEPATLWAKRTTCSTSGFFLWQIQPKQPRTTSKKSISYYIKSPQILLQQLCPGPSWADGSRSFESCMRSFWSHLKQHAWLKSWEFRGQNNIVNSSVCILNLAGLLVLLYPHPQQISRNTIMKVYTWFKQSWHVILATLSPCHPILMWCLVLTQSNLEIINHVSHEQLVDWAFLVSYMSESSTWKL